MTIGVIKKIETRVNGAIIEDAPDWYDTPLDQLDFQWSQEEKLEIERYCEKIHKNIAEEEMTPKARFEAMMTGKPKDRQFISLSVGCNYVSRVLDSAADAITPGDVIRNPKLFVKAHLATLARFAPDWPMFMITIYSGIGLYGGKVKVIEYGHPVIVDYPIKSIADLEGLETPDPKKDGMFPGYLWANREFRRIFDEYGLSEVIPFWSSMCPGAETLVMEAMTGITPFMKALRTDQEFCKRTVAIAQEFASKLGRAIIEAGRPEIIQCCQYNGMFPLKGNEWIADAWADLAKDLKSFSPQTVLTNGLTALSTFAEFTDTLRERGGAGPDSWDGGITGPETIIEKMIDYYRENNMFFTSGIPGKVLEEGPISAIEEECKKLCEYSKSSSKFSPSAMPALVHWTPFEHVDAAMAALKKYGKY